MTAPDPIHNGHAPAAEASASPAPPTLTPLDPTELRVALSIATGDDTAADIDATDFLNILARPHVRAWIEARKAADDLRRDFAFARLKEESLQALGELVRDKAADPVERRRAASSILRALRPPPIVRANRATDCCSEQSAPRASTPSKPEPSEARATDCCSEQSVLRASAPRKPEPTGARATDCCSEQSVLRDETPGKPEPTKPERNAEAARYNAAMAAAERRYQARKADADAIRSRFDFNSSEGAAKSVAKILTGADPGDPEAAFNAIFLLTAPARRPEKIEQYFEKMREIHAAAGATLVSLDRTHFGWSLVVQPRQGTPPVPGGRQPGADQMRLLLSVAKDQFTEYYEINELTIWPTCLIEDISPRLPANNEPRPP